MIATVYLLILILGRDEIEQINYRFASKDDCEIAGATWDLPLHGRSHVCITVLPPGSGGL